MNTTSEKPNLVHQEKVEQLVLKDNNKENKRKVDGVCLTSGPLKDSERYLALNTEDNKTLDFGENEAIYKLGTNYSNVGSESSAVNQEIFTEREVDYGQESKVKEKKLDHDEDKDDPQYIPKGGKFYEHDNRTSAVKETTGSKNQDICKANESNDKWYHDLYDDSAQFPKSIEELIEEYGYDIRNEEGPPPNALFRRYCSEPNMYTRQWEEEACMNRVGGSEHIPSSACGTLLSAKKNCQEIEVRVKNGEKYMTPGRRVNTKETLARNQSWLYERAQDTQSFYNSLDKQQNSTSKEDIAIHTQYFWNLEAKYKIKEKDKTRGTHEIVMTEQYPARTKSLCEKEHDPQLLNSGLILQQSSTAEEDIATLSYHFSEAVINVDNLPIKSQRVSSVPAAGNSGTVGKSEDFQGKKRKSKRYSIQVQRSLPQGNTGPLVQQSPPVLSRHYQPLYIHIDEVVPGADMPERILSISNKSVTEHEFQLPPPVE